MSWFKKEEHLICKAFNELAVKSMIQEIENLGLSGSAYYEFIGYLYKIHETFLNLSKILQAQKERRLKDGKSR